MTPNARNALNLTIAGAQITVSANGQVLGTTTAGFGDFRVTPGP